MFKSAFGSIIFWFLVYRVSSVFFIQTSYVPDEYWQSLEVAHNMVFGYGYLTWEWQYGLRSYIYPAIFATLYKILNFLQLDSQVALTVIPRLAQAVFTALSDYYFLKLSKSLGCKAFWTKVFIFTNWFWYYCGSRTILNMFETSMTIFALHYYPWNVMKQKFSKSNSNQTQWNSVRNQSIKYLSIAALNCLIRPTAITIWAPLVLFQMVKLYPTRIAIFVFKTTLPVCLLLFGISLYVDYIWYGKLTFPPYNFLLFNINSGIASFYGEHPFHWYLSQGLPVILGLHILPFVAGIHKVFRKFKKPIQDKFDKIYSILLWVVLINILVFSLIPHKEFRFVLPLLPMMEVMSIKFMSDSSSFNSKKISRAVLTTILITGFIVPVALFGIYHQKGTLTVINYLAGIAHKQPDNTSLLFLTPCHSTPLYSHLHVNIPVRFLTCNPPLTPDHYDESDKFFKKPIAWLENNWNILDGPSHVVCFDSIQEYVDDFLKEKGFVLKRSFVHTIFSGSSSGDNVLVYER